MLLKVSRGGKVDSALFETEQLAAHGFAWLKVYVEALKAKGAYKGQAQCKSGAGTGTQAHSKYGEFELTCTAGTILFDIELDYHLFTSRAVGKPLSANAYVEFSGTLVEFDFHESSKPRQIVAKAARAAFPGRFRDALRQALASAK